MQKDKYQVRLVDEGYYRDIVSCQAACPVHTDASGYVNAVATRDFKNGYLIARQPNPFVSVCGRVCAAPCEQACRRNNIDGRPITIRSLKRYLCEHHGVESEDFADIRRALSEMSSEDPALRNSRTAESFSSIQRLRGSHRPKVAVIGAGPAGLTAAHDLSIMGYSTTVFEASGGLGGMLVLGIPEYRMPRDKLKLEIDDILKNGVEVRLNTRVGVDITVAGLKKEGFQAIFIATGAHRNVPMGLPGEQLKGVISGVEFLRKVNLGEAIDVGTRVAVVGGGNVAMDAVRTALRLGEDQNFTMDAARTVSRLGAKKAFILYRRSREEMPASEVEIAQSLQEGIEIHYQVSPKRIVGENGIVQAVECVRMALGEPDEGGRRRPMPVEGSEFMLQADTVISAIGQVGDLSFLTPEDNVAVTQHGTIAVDAATLATTEPRVFAGGDVAFGPRIIIEAVRDGHRAAQTIDRFLRGEPGSLQSQFTMTPVTAERLPHTTWLTVPHKYASTLPVVERQGFKEVERVFDAATAATQASRCLRCNIQTVFDSDKCILCGGCVDVCPRDCYRIVRLDRLAPEGEVDHVIEARFGIDLKTLRERGQGMDRGAAILKDEDNCVRCGLCAERCPTGAITMEAFSFREETSISSETGGLKK